MDAWKTATGRSEHGESKVTIEGLTSEISRLNVELTCASEAHHALLVENERMKAALRAAEKAFTAAGNKEMVQVVKTSVSGERPKSSGFKLPPSRKVA